MSKERMSRAEYDRIGKDIVHFPDKAPLDHVPEELTAKDFEVVKLWRELGLPIVRRVHRLFIEVRS